MTSVPAVLPVHGRGADRAAAVTVERSARDREEVAVAVRGAAETGRGGGVRCGGQREGGGGVGGVADGAVALLAADTDLVSR